MTGRPGWLIGQLPRVMGDDPVLRDFVNAFEQVHDTVRERINAHLTDGPVMLQN